MGDPASRQCHGLGIRFGFAPGQETETSDTLEHEKYGDVSQPQNAKNLPFLIGDWLFVIQSSQVQGRQMANDKSEVANDKFGGPISYPICAPLTGGNTRRIYEIDYLGRLT